MLAPRWSRRYAQAAAGEPEAGVGLSPRTAVVNTQPAGAAEEALSCGDDAAITNCRLRSLQRPSQDDRASRKPLHVNWQRPWKCQRIRRCDHDHRRGQHDFTCNSCLGITVADGGRDPLSRQSTSPLHFEPVPVTRVWLHPHAHQSAVHLPVVAPRAAFVASERVAHWSASEELVKQPTRRSDIVRNRAQSRQDVMALLTAIFSSWGWLETCQYHIPVQTHFIYTDLLR